VNTKGKEVWADTLLDREWLILGLRRKLGQVRLLWLHGPRGCGKTAVVKRLGLEEMCYIDCEDPEVSAQMASPERFVADLTGRIVVLDEVHVIAGASELVKQCLRREGTKLILVSSAISDLEVGLPPEQIAGYRLGCLRNDEFPEGTAMPTLRRLHRGGLPKALFAEGFPADVFLSWHDSVLLRDLQWAHGSRVASKLSRLLLYVLQHSGESMKVSQLAPVVGVNKTTLGEYLDLLEAMGIVWFVAPYGVPSGKESAERRRIFAFDTGLVSWSRGWRKLNQIDPELLWRHLALGHLRSSNPDATIYFWEEDGATLDFVLEDQESLVAVDCRWDASQYSTSAFEKFNARVGHREVRNYLVCNSSIDQVPDNLQRHRIVLQPLDGWGPAPLRTPYEAAEDTFEPKPTEPVEKSDYPDQPSLARRRPLTVEELVWLLEKVPGKLPAAIGLADANSAQGPTALDIEAVVVYGVPGNSQVLVLDVESDHAMREIEIRSSGEGKGVGRKTVLARFDLMFAREKAQ
jgi:predicted AAA+ superfamily ATPase